jgi:hypothetical protein
MTARRILMATAVFVAVGALGACGVPVDNAPREAHPPAAARDRLAAGAPTTKPSGSVPEHLFLIRDGNLVPVVRHVGVAPSVNTHLADLLAGPDAREQADGLSSALLGVNPVSTVTMVNHVAHVELADPTAAGNARNDDQLGYAQLVCTLTTRPDIVGVVFTRDGQPIGVPRGDGSLSTGPLSGADYANLIADS